MKRPGSKRSASMPPPAARDVSIVVPAGNTNEPRRIGGQVSRTMPSITDRTCCTRGEALALSATCMTGRTELAGALSPRDVGGSPRSYPRPANCLAAATMRGPTTSTSPSRSVRAGETSPSAGFRPWNQATRIPAGFPKKAALSRADKHQADCRPHQCLDSKSLTENFCVANDLHTMSPRHTSPSCPSLTSINALMGDIAGISTCFVPPRIPRQGIHRRDIGAAPRRGHQRVRRQNP